jgi:hypothetical protein
VLLPVSEKQDSTPPLHQQHPLDAKDTGLQGRTSLLSDEADIHLLLKPETP